ncbi:hypothetical protein [Halodesulfovibrio sp.]|uniref:hypothetical protein n=1 Tax=Halodesulfovibrio sp. TaxID=1912772 RepID=UPI0025D763AE|nr:hypothetical protein [Halodesulfovibrio sp.]MCT4625636.1 hypothetical protein [Halodesulfovibrio sp.]
MMSLINRCYESFRPSSICDTRYLRAYALRSLIGIRRGFTALLPMQLRGDEWKNDKLTPEEECDEFAFLYEDFWNEGERDLLFRYFSHDLTLNREEYKKASKRSDDLETEALRFGVTSFLPVDELVAEDHNRSACLRSLANSHNRATA